MWVHLLLVNLARASTGSDAFRIAIAWFQRIQLGSSPPGLIAATAEVPSVPATSPETRRTTLSVQRCFLTRSASESRQGHGQAFQP